MNSLVYLLKRAHRFGSEVFSKKRSDQPKHNSNSLQPTFCFIKKKKKVYLLGSFYVPGTVLGPECRAI